MLTILAFNAHNTGAGLILQEGNRCHDALEIYYLLIGCPLPKRKCLGAPALSKTKHTALKSILNQLERKKSSIVLVHVKIVYTMNFEKVLCSSKINSGQPGNKFELQALWSCETLPQIQALYWQILLKSIINNKKVHECYQLN